MEVGQNVILPHTEGNLLEQFIKKKNQLFLHRWEICHRILYGVGNVSRFPSQTWDTDALVQWEQEDSSAQSGMLLGYLAPELPVPCSLINWEFCRASAVLGRCFMKISVLHKPYLLQFVLVIEIFLPAGN